jgi:hypothetical protein
MLVDLCETRDPSVALRVLARARNLPLHTVRPFGNALGVIRARFREPGDSHVRGSNSGRGDAHAAERARHGRRPWACKRSQDSVAMQAAVERTGRYSQRVAEGSTRTRAAPNY